MDDQMGQQWLTTRYNLDVELEDKSSEALKEDSSFTGKWVCDS